MRITRLPRLRLGRAVGSALAIKLAVVAGCVVPRPAPAPSIGQTQVDRLVRAYPDLRAGRFATIADFEDSRHMEIVQLKRASAGARLTLEPGLGRGETGGTCVAFTPASPQDTLTIGNAAATQWYLRRDWSAYDLLLMSIHAPRPGLSLGLSIAGGPRAERFSAATSIRLREGWNLERIDLAEIGERVPLRGIHEINLTVGGATGPVTVRLDDIILTESRETLLGDPADENGGLYAMSVGRRWKLGARKPAQFELTFANGQIVEWYNLAVDPGRQRNLVWGTALGPALVTPDGRGVDRAVAVSSRIVELSDVRVIIATEWRADDREAWPRDAGPSPAGRRVTYTVYPTGQVFVHLSSPIAPGPDTGLAVSVAASPQSGLETMMTSREEGRPSSHIPTYAAARLPVSESLLLFVVRDDAGTTRVERLVAETGESGDSAERTSLVAFPPDSAESQSAWNCHLLLASSAALDGSEILARAFGYAAPVLPHLELGTYESTDYGGAKQIGFDSGTGCFLISPERGQVRLILDGSLQPYYGPAFRIRNPERRDARVYVDHLIFDRAFVDAEGNVIFQLPFTVDRRVMVEVLFAQSP